MTRPDSPRAAFRTLLAGNRRFLADETLGPNRGLDRVAALAGGQQPWAAILGCADSRVPLEILFDAGFGDIFVVRVAGNVASAEQIGSLEYAVTVLGTPLVIVLGHTGCGAVQAALADGPAPGRIPTLLHHIGAALDPDDADVDRAVEANVLHQLRTLRNDSSAIRAGIAAGTTGLVGAVVDTPTGLVRVLEASEGLDG